MIEYLGICASLKQEWTCSNYRMSIVNIATDKRGYPHNIFLISRQLHMLWYSLEVPRQGASNEYPQHMFLLRNKKDISIFRMKKLPYLLLCSKELRCSNTYGKYSTNKVFKYLWQVQY